MSIQGEGSRSIGTREVNLLAVSKVISARVKEILAHVAYQIKLSNFERKLIGGIVLTGGGSQLKHLAQLTEAETGQCARLGLPREHLASTKMTDVDSPIYATGIGLLIRGFKLRDEEMLDRDNTFKTHETPAKEIKVEEDKVTTPVQPDTTVDITAEVENEKEVVSEKGNTVKKEKISLVSTWGKKLTTWMQSDVDDFDSK